MSQVGLVLGIFEPFSRAETENSSQSRQSHATISYRLKDTLHPVHMRQPVVAVGTKHCQPVDAVDTKGCCCNTCFGRFHRLVYPQHRISKGVADYLSEVSQSSKAEWWIYFVLWLGLWEFWPWVWKSNQIQYKGGLLPPWINFNSSMDKWSHA